MKLLNLGCGTTYHPDWVNIDLHASPPHVIGHDLKRGIPFPDASFDAVYTSHVLEHIPPAHAAAFLNEAVRVLKPGGVMRVVVPDLETICRLYLDKLAGAVESAPGAANDYDWMMIELLDQTTRTRSGGLMASYLRNPQLGNAAFVTGRIGCHVASIRGTESSGPAPGLLSRLRRVPPSRLFQLVRERLTLGLVRLLMGPDGSAALKEGLFRNSGEIHQWMYDRFSLARLLESVGLEGARSCAASESAIRDFERYQLDRLGTQVRKPDSLFMEAFKPAAGAASGARATFDRSAV
ncbi:hypothetical protein D3C86_1156070 [compost metagenome]